MFAVRRTPQTSIADHGGNVMERRKWMRFSLRLLLGTITLVCVFLASWNACRHRAVSDVKVASGGWTPRIVAPYLLSVEKSDNVTVVETYHFWCFGQICDLPYSHQFPETGGFFSVVRPRIIIQGEEPELLGLPIY